MDKVKEFIGVEVDGQRFVDLDMVTKAIGHADGQIKALKAKLLLLEVLLDEALEFIEDQADMVQGEDGDEPNAAMSLVSAIRADLEGH